MEEENKNLLVYFDKFKEYSNFDKLKEKLDKDSEMKYILKYYDGGDIENIEEAIILLDIKYQETNDENYLKVKDKLIAGANILENDLEFLIKQTDIMTSSLVFYLL